jgi:hypothetical protein
VFPAEHLLDFAGLDLGRELVERAAEIVGNRLSRFSPFDEHVEVVEPTPQRVAQIAIFLEPAAALQQLLRAGLILPEVRCGDTFFDFGELGGGTGGVKDGSAGPRRAAPDLRTCEADRLFEEPYQSWRLAVGSRRLADGSQQPAADRQRPVYRIRQETSSAAIVNASDSHATRSPMRV